MQSHDTTRKKSRATFHPILCQLKVANHPSNLQQLSCRRLLKKAVKWRTSRALMGLINWPPVLRQ